VFESGIDLTMIGLDVTHKALMTRAHAQRLRSSGRVGTMVAELYDFFSQFHLRQYGSEDSPIHDAVAVAHMLRPELVETAYRHVAIDTESELCRGRTVVDLWQRTENEPNAHVGVGIDGGAFIELLIERIASLG
jgi:pyrimidine-specific ribonucleoside hydrolase